MGITVNGFEMYTVSNPAIRWMGITSETTRMMIIWIPTVGVIPMNRPKAVPSAIDSGDPCSCRSLLRRPSRGVFAVSWSVKASTIPVVDRRIGGPPR